MSVGFKAVQWNRHKLVYDLVLLLGIGLYLGSFLWLAPLVFPVTRPVTWEIREIRAFGSCAFVMLSLILCIGPLARLDRRFAPILYNRRHFGVLTAMIALTHAWLVLGWYDAEGVRAPMVALLSANPRYGSFIQFPFEILGLGALVILVLMAATSHDFWLSFLTPPVWKALHMGVYAAFALLVMHIALGEMQSEHSPLLALALGGDILLVSGLHIASALRSGAIAAGPWLRVGRPDEIEFGCARIITPAQGERIAVFRHARGVSAVSNVCAHQNGPLGEGRIIDGCITCPWHGFQFRPEDGCAPPPFTDKIATYRLKLEAGVIQVDVTPLPPGTFVPALVVGV